MSSSANNSYSLKYCWSWLKWKLVQHYGIHCLSDESWFHLNTILIWHNSSIWVYENLICIYEIPIKSPGVAVSVVMFHDWIIWPHCFKDQTMNEQNYLQKCWNHFSFHSLKPTCFHHDGAPTHWRLEASAFLDNFLDWTNGASQYVISNKPSAPADWFLEVPGIYG